MRNRSKNDFSFETEKLEPIRVDPAYPVSEATYNTRGEEPEVAPHLHNMLELGYCYDGSGVFLIGGKVFPFQAGDAVVISSREVHLAKGSPGGTTRWGWINLDPLLLLADIPESCGGSMKLSRYNGPAFRNVIDGGGFPEIVDCIRRILAESSGKVPHYRSMVRSLVWQLALLLTRYCEEAEKRATTETGTGTGDFREVERIAPALNHIAGNFQHPVSVANLARLCFMSEPNFRKCFRRAMGVAAKPYIQKIRLQAAAALLRGSERSILEIARLCGYNNLSNFNRQFRDAHGCAPREFRREESFS